MARSTDDRMDVQRMTSIARAKGYEGEACGECGNVTVVRNGAALTCETCGFGQSESPRAIGTPEIVRTGDTEPEQKTYPILDGFDAIANQ